MSLNAMLTGALIGFERAEGKYSLLLPFDTPFVSKDIVDLMFDLCCGRSAVVPKWPDQQTEPFPAVYQTEGAIGVAQIAIIENMFNMGSMIEKMRGVRFL